jgi:hypothetical protein
MVLATPNRFSLAPEPHVGVWGVGFLPRRLMEPYVQLMRKIDFRAIQTLGLSEWKRLIRRSAFRSCEISAPRLPDEGASKFRLWLGRAYNRVVRSRIGQAAAKRVGPLFHIVGERPSDPAIPGASRAIRPRSTPSAAAR